MLAFFQAVGEKSNNMGSNSSLPAIMLKQRTSLLPCEKSEKLPIGPITSNPGPTLDNVDKTAVAEVIRSFPLRVISSNDTKNINMYAKKKLKFY